MRTKKDKIEPVNTYVVRSTIFGNAYSGFVDAKSTKAAKVAFIARILRKLNKPNTNMAKEIVRALAYTYAKLKVIPKAPLPPQIVKSPVNIKPVQSTFNF